MSMSNSKSDNIKFVGIDFSLNSPAFCVLSGGESHIGSLHRTSENPDKVWKKKNSAFKELESIGASIKVYQKWDIDGEYHVKESMKMRAFIYLTDEFFSLIEPHIDDNTIIGMEGLSFGSSGNSLIDISMATSLLRLKILGKIPDNRFFVFSPSTIKKFAVKGNAKKEELYRALIDIVKKEGREDLRKFTETLETNQDTWIKKSKTVETPCSDMIDATWISLFLENNSEKLLNPSMV